MDEIMAIDHRACRLPFFLGDMSACNGQRIRIGQTQGHVGATYQLRIPVLRRWRALCMWCSMAFVWNTAFVTFYCPILDSEISCCATRFFWSKGCAFLFSLGRSRRCGNLISALESRNTSFLPLREMNAAENHNDSFSVFSARWLHSTLLDWELHAALNAVTIQAFS